MRFVSVDALKRFYVKLGEYFLAKADYKLYEDKGINTDGAISQAGITSLLFNSAYGVQLGDGAYSKNRDSVAIGRNSNAGDSSSAFALGAGTSCNGYNTAAVGYGAKTEKNYNLALGSTSQATANYAVAIGRESKAQGASAVSLGQGSLSTQTASVALGAQAECTAREAVAIGYNCMNNETKTVAVNNYRITQLANGTADTDAVTVSQLNALIARVEALENN